MDRSRVCGLAPSPTESAPCGSKSTSSTLRPYSARAAPRLMVVVVLPTPPFWLAMAMIRAGPCRSVGIGSGIGFRVVYAAGSDGPSSAPRLSPDCSVRSEAVQDSAWSVLATLFPKDCGSVLLSDCTPPGHPYPGHRSAGVSAGQVESGLGPSAAGGRVRSHLRTWSVASSPATQAALVISPS